MVCKTSTRTSPRGRQSCDLSTCEAWRVALFKYLFWFCGLLGMNWKYGFAMSRLQFFIRIYGVAQEVAAEKIRAAMKEGAKSPVLQKDQTISEIRTSTRSSPYFSCHISKCSQFLPLCWYFPTERQVETDAWLDKFEATFLWLSPVHNCYLPLFYILGRDSVPSGSLSLNLGWGTTDGVQAPSRSLATGKAYTFAWVSQLKIMARSCFQGQGFFSFLQLSKCPPTATVSFWGFAQSLAVPWGYSRRTLSKQDLIDLRARAMLNPAEGTSNASTDERKMMMRCS